MTEAVVVRGDSESPMTIERCLSIVNGVIGSRSRVDASHRPICSSDGAAFVRNCYPQSCGFIRRCTIFIYGVLAWPAGARCGGSHAGPIALSQ